MADWKPIETAPKDGTWLWAYFPGWVLRDQSMGSPCPGQMETFWAGDSENGLWVTPGRTCGEERNPTHWMPYPDPPETTP